MRLGSDPYGFIGRLQAIRSGWDKAPLEIISILVSKDPAMVESFIEMVKNCECFDDGNQLAEVLNFITELTEEQEEKLVTAFNENAQVSGSYGFSGERPYRHGEGLAHHLKRITGSDYFTYKENYKLNIGKIPF